MSKIAIIGAGIVGASIARILSRYKGLEVILIEKEPDVGWGATKANTGIVHPGHEDDPKEHPLRAELCVKGNRLWHEWTEELDIPVKWAGELMLARGDDELEILERYLSLGRRNGVTRLDIVHKDRLRELEPMVHRKAEYALWAPTAGVIAPWEAVIGLVENAVQNDVKISLNTEVRDIRVRGNEVKSLSTDKGEIDVDIVINAGGLFADEISSMAGIDDFDIRPRKGQYYLFDEDVRNKPQRIVHPTPTEKTKGVYAVQTVEGNLMLGPTAEDLSIDDKDERSTSTEGLNYVWEHSVNLLKELPSKSDISKTFAGLRPEPPEGKYIIQGYDRVSGFINVAGIRSPGLTAAPAIAEKVIGLLTDRFDMKLIEKDRWQPFRKSMTKFSDQSRSKKETMIEKDPRYGKVVCMCKEVTKAEILEAVKRIQLLDTDVTLDSIKFRTLALFGFCQGSFCRAKIAEVLSDELNIPMWDIKSGLEGTEYGIGDVKKLLREEAVD